MPTKWAPPEIFLKHGRVTVYRTYKNDDLDMPAREYRYGWSEGCGEAEDAFDVRDLPNPRRHNVATEEGRKAILRDAIDAGILTDGGVVAPEMPSPHLTIKLPEAAWRLLNETLHLDAESAAFDPDLRERVSQALAQVQIVSGPGRLLFAALEVLHWAERTGGCDTPCWKALRAAVKEAGEESDSATADEALRRVHDLLYLDMDPERGEFYNPHKTWDADTLDAIADVVRPFFPGMMASTQTDSTAERTPAERAESVARIERIPPYSGGLDDHGRMSCPSEFITDLLADIRHYCDRRGVDFRACDRTAADHHRHERQCGKEVRHG